MATLEQLNAALRKPAGQVTKPAGPVTLESLNAALTRRPASPATIDTASVDTPDSTGAVQAGMGGDFLSALSGAGEFVGSLPVPLLSTSEEIRSEFANRTGLDPDAPLAQGFRVRDIGESASNIGSDLAGFASGIHQMVNPFADTQGVDEEGNPITIEDGGGPLDALLGIGGALTQNPGGTLEAIGGAPALAMRVLAGDPTASAKLREELVKHPATTGFDVVPQGAVVKNLGKLGELTDLSRLPAGASGFGLHLAQNLIEDAGALPDVIGRGVSAVKRTLVGDDALNRIADASVGVSSGVQDAAGVVRRRAREGDNTKIVKGFGSEDLEDVGTLTNKLKNIVFGAVPNKANDIYETNFKSLKLKDANKPLDFNAPRIKMFDTLRNKFGIDARGFADGETVVNSWAGAHALIRDNPTAQRHINEAIAKIDAMRERYKGLQLTEDKSRGGLTGTRKVKTGRETTYTLEEVKDDLDGLRETQFKKKPGVNMKWAKKVVDDLVTNVRRELGDKLDGFDDMQAARELTFKETDKLIEAFFGNNPKALRDKWKSEGDILVPDQAKSRVEQLLAPKDTHVARKQVAQAYQDFVKKEFDIDIDIEKAVAQVRLAGDAPKGIARAGLAGGLVGGGTWAFFGLAGPLAIAPLLGGMLMTSPRIVGQSWRALGMAQGKVDKLVDGMKRGRQFLREKGLEARVIDAMTINEMISRSLRDRGDILTEIATPGAQPEE